ncbi:response regulator transcription factor [Actinomadura vinacea]|uniref:Response regulator transcription factor n=1 Tax=Actinomadura vinacea TaxID=115336 RepID=A0ABN3JKV2_9ACTN
MTAGGGRPIRVILVDDHPVVREGLAAMLRSAADIEVVGQAGSGDEAVALCPVLEPDVVLMDLRMERMDGAASTAAIVSAAPRIRVLIVTTYETDSDILRAIEAGATGYVLKGSSRDELIAAIHAAARGETVLSPSVASRLFQVRARPAPNALSEREREILRLVGRGLSNAEIGKELLIGEATVKTYLLRAYRKLEVSDRTAAVVAAMERGLLG